MSTWVPVPEWAEGRVGDISIPGKVEDRFDKCQRFAEDQLDTAHGFMQNMESYLRELEEDGTDFDVERYHPYPPNIEPIDYNERPVPEDYPLEDIPENSIAQPVWREIEHIEEPVFDNFTETAPDTKIEWPEHDVIAKPTGPAALESIEYPAKPDNELPAEPNIPDITFPTAPVITVSEFEGEVPTEIWDMPENFSYTEADYGSDIWADLLAKVLNDIRNGGTGLGATIEEELYDRALARQETENERLYQEVENYFEARGFTLPVGAMAGRLAEVAREVSRNNTEINSKIMIDQAQLAQANTHFIIEQGIRLEGMLRDFFNAQANRAFEASRTIAQIGIELFNANVNKFNAKVGAYQAQAAVYESKIKAALTQAEIYKAQISACEVKSKVNKNTIDMYNGKVEAFNIIAKLYTAEMEAVKTKAEVENLKLERFNLDIQNYIAQINADKAIFDATAAEMNGKQIEMQVYSEKVKAYSQKIEAQKVKHAALIQNAELSLKANQWDIEEYKAELAGYEMELKGTSERNSKILNKLEQDTAKYIAELDSQKMYLDKQSRQWALEVDNAHYQLDRAIAQVNASIEGFKALKSLQGAGVEGLMNVGAQLAASSMNAINANASMGTTQTGQESESWSHHESMTESHPYEEQAPPS